jgi:hypothetical protein
MSVVRQEERRRWLVMAASVALLCAAPVAVQAWPVDDPSVDAEALRALIRRSADRPYEGYAESVGVLGLPALPRLARVTELVSGNTRMRAWYAARDRWRVDVIATGQERGVYRTPQGVVSWDYGDNQRASVPLTQVGGVVRQVGPEIQFTDIIGESPNRLPRGADLLPPDLARRVLDLAGSDPVTPVAAKRVAGVTAAGLRVTSADPHTTVGHIDIWADPRTGLPLEVAVTARNAERPILVTRFLEVEARTPAADVLTPPAPGGNTSVVEVEQDESFTIFESGISYLPPTIAGLTRSDAEMSRRGRLQPGETRVLRFGTGTAYGTGLARLLVLTLNERIARDVMRSARAWGQEVTVADGDATLIAAPLLSVMVVHVHSINQTFLIAGLVDGILLQQFGTELAAVVVTG